VAVGAERLGEEPEERMLAAKGSATNFSLFSPPHPCVSKFPVAFQKEPCHYSCWKPKGWSPDEGKAGRFARNACADGPQDTGCPGPQHGYGIARRIEQISGDLLAVNQGTLYPLLLKLEHEGSIASQWGASENNRRARFYRLTAAGRKQLQAETRDWEQTAAIIARFFKVKAEDLP
jgi:PadR family transcriptional regulator, regulatory protein PadR